MIIYLVTDGHTEQAYKPTREAALKYAEFLHEQYADYTEAIEIWEVRVQELTPELVCNMVNGVESNSWNAGQQLLRRVWPKEG